VSRSVNSEIPEFQSASLQSWLSTHYGLTPVDIPCAKTIILSCVTFTVCCDATCSISCSIQHFCICLSRASIVSKRMNVWWCRLHSWVAQCTSFRHYKVHQHIHKGSPII